MRVRRLFIPVVVVALVMTACSRSGGSSKGSSSTTAGKAANAATGDFGNLKGVCGPGQSKGSTDLGVSDSTIRVGTMADPGNTVSPGLDQELFDTADAFVKWCNAAGGIDGRQLQLDKWDAKLFEVPARMIEACAVNFALIGNGEGLDSSGVEQRTKCKLPEITAYDVSAAAGTAPLSLQALSTSDHQSDLGGAYKALAAFDPEAIKHYGLLSNQYQSIKDSGDRARAAAKLLGYTEVYYDEQPIQVDNYRAYTQSAQSKGVQVFTNESSPAEVSRVFKAFQAVGYVPKYSVFSTNMYDPSFIQNAGPALQGKILINTYIVPFELADQYPAVKQYINMLNQYANGAKPKALGVNGMSAWLLFAKSVKECGSNLTRACLMSKAGSVKAWDSGGLSAPTEPGNATGPTERCFVLLQATPTGFVIDKDITKPNNGIFNCSDQNRIELPGFPK
jgi:ABC-type branched-subunit amino acid transport system substrate-binding protein